MAIKNEKKPERERGKKKREVLIYNNPPPIHTHT
jgi:hypothetical protein